ncbi:hypothetical protein G4X40_20285 [Rhodococcus sp. D2-41]|uniref:hypothetical protein n=1 Tax=Speluncibacter jeojiensis TaxID=2710754 RepID=UPI002410244B|nr:hypothetical protein [Rhodococcus sp. D2-41]MDG3012482.1 hypothetical protein [Rhodococcus sp. D2-41]
MTGLHTTAEVRDAAKLLRAYGLTTAAKDLEHAHKQERQIDPGVDEIARHMQKMAGGIPWGALTADRRREWRAHAAAALDKVIELGWQPGTRVVDPGMTRTSVINIEGSGEPLVQIAKAGPGIYKRYGR